MDQETKSEATCDTAACVAGIAVGLALGVIGCALAYFTLRRRRTLDGGSMRPLNTDWFEKGNG
ncbi:hypothetical protein [Cupriavidus sp. D384]|uniref:hypothetical protein n=1 Tax=Cupriavidus sp. D384 TaxID=1538095 RepID=UPI0012E7886B|nr:hypothetical protein [Cupriavidus sp. D384]